MAHVEGEHVHKVYSQIAQHFSDTRFKPWPRIAQFLMDQPPGSVIADVGCGNGKYLGVNPHAYKLGSDICPELVAIAASRGHEVAVCNCLNLPYRSDQFDAAICIAVVHHLSTAVRRVAALKELVRIVRPKGRILVYVWAMEQEKRKFEAQDVMVPWHLQPKYRDRQPPPRQPQSGGRAKQTKPRKPRKRKTKEHFADVEGSSSESVTSRVQSDMVGESFLELSAISLYNDDDGQWAKECDNSRHSSQLPDSAVGSEQPLKGQDRKKHSEGETSSPGVSACRYEATVTTVVGNIEGTGSGTNAGMYGFDRTGNTVAGAASCPTVTVLNKQGFQTGSTSQPTVEVTTSGCASTETDVDSQNTTLVEQGYQTFQRYYHVFKRGELLELFAGVQGAKVLEEFYDHENWCVLAEKSCESPLL